MRRHRQVRSTLVSHLARLLAGALRARTAPHGVAPGQFAQMLALYERDGVTLPTDGRRALIWLTAEARELESTLTSAAQDVNALAARGLAEDEIRESRRLLGKMINNLEPGTTRS